MKICQHLLLLLSVLVLGLVSQPAQANFRLWDPRLHIPWDVADRRIFPLEVLQGKVVQITDAGYQGLPLVTIQVESIYFDPGRPDLQKNFTVGQTFSFIPDPQFLLWADPPYQVGQEGIFQVMRDDPKDYNTYGHSVVTCDICSMYWMPCPTRKGVEPFYSQVLALVHYQQKIFPLPLSEQEKPIEQAMFDKNPRIAAWGIDEMGYCFPKEFEPLAYQRLRDPQCPLRDQLEIDSALMDAFPSWNASSERMAMLHRWVKMPLTDPIPRDVVIGIQSRLYNAYSNGQGILTDQEYHDLLQTLFDNPTLPAERKADVGKDLQNLEKKMQAPMTQTPKAQEPNKQ